ncbi:MAG: phosphoribosylglycinamide formyltransferase [bacterium]|nr:phosphoribosylglycinamide formyltransferase [bacterium]
MNRFQLFKKIMSEKRLSPLKLGVLVSGNGTNLQALIEASQQETLQADVTLVISDNPEATAVTRAKNEKIPVAIIEPSQFNNREAFEDRLAELLEKAAVDLVVLAGFMRLLSPAFVKKFKGRLVNIHPALLPAFPGLHVIQKAFDDGVRYTGVTVHFVDEGTDTGPIIAQAVVPIEPEDSLESLEQKIHVKEHKLYPAVLQLFAEGRVQYPTRGRRVMIQKKGGTL